MENGIIVATSAKSTIQYDIIHPALVWSLKTLFCFIIG